MSITHSSKKCQHVMSYIYKYCIIRTKLLHRYLKKAYAYTANFQMLLSQTLAPSRIIWVRVHCLPHLGTPNLNNTQHSLSWRLTRFNFKHGAPSHYTKGSYPTCTKERKTNFLWKFTNIKCIEFTPEYVDFRPLFHLFFHKNTAISCIMLRCTWMACKWRWRVWLRLVCRSGWCVIFLFVESLVISRHIACEK